MSLTFELIDMAKLSDLTRMQNCFFTVDGQVLKTMQDIANYLSVCSEESYNHHVNPERNDFANWANSVLLRPRFGSVLANSKSLDEARAAVADFFQRVDYKNALVPEEKSFHTVDGYSLKSVHELYYYINNCSEGGFNYHCNPSKNDFANWINDVLGFPSLAERMRSTGTREGIINVLRGFLLSRMNNVVDPEYERYLNQHEIKRDGPINKDDPVKNDKKDGLIQSKPLQAPASIQNTPAAIQAPETPARTSTENNDIHAGLRSDEIITLKPLDLGDKEEEEEEKKPEANIDKNAFRQFTDEELEKFSSFVRQEKSVDTDVKTEYLKSVVAELKNMIKELRLVEKDPFMADLMLRNISAKVDYYALSKNPDDYNHIIQLMRNVQQEIEDCSTHSTYNLADEMYKDLKLQGIVLKKA